jgi:undecaprenyl-diphosphatase
VERGELQQDRTLALGFVGAVAALLVFGWMARSVLAGETIAFDAAVRNWVHGWASPRMTYAMRGLSWIGSEIVLIPLGVMAALLLKRAGRKHAAILFIVASLGGEALDQLLKLVFHRTRPEAFFGYRLPASYSFPSGHAMSSFCFYVVLAAILTLRMPGARAAAIWALGGGLALSIGLSRIYLGVHYPSDVLAGFLAGLIWVSSVRMGYVFWLKRRRGRE